MTASAEGGAAAGGDRRLRVVLIVPICEAGDVGEAWWGHQIASRMAERVDATIVTMVRRGNRGQVRDRIRNARVIEFEDWPLSSVSERFDAIAKPGYLKFHWLARRAIRRLLREERFDLIHQFTPFAIRYPSPGVGLGPPFVIGPVGGSVSTPRGFEADLTAMAWYTRLRRLDELRFRIDPILRRTYRQAAVAIACAPYAHDVLRAMGAPRVETMLETAIEELPSLAGRAPHDGPLRLLNVGRVVRTKGVLYAIRALPRVLAAAPATLDVVGAGDDLEPCAAEAQRLGVAAAVRFHGRKPRADVSRAYLDADLFVFPSLREPSGTVVLEAMSFGLPLIVTDRGGPGHTVGDAFGARVAAEPYEEFPSRIADAILRIARDRDAMRRMGAGARKRVREQHLWDARIEKLLAIYRDVAAAPRA